MLELELQTQRGRRSAFIHTSLLQVTRPKPELREFKDCGFIWLSRRGFAAGCEAGLRPAANFQKKLGAMPLVRPLAQGFSGRARTEGIAQFLF